MVNVNYFPSTYKKFLSDFVTIGNDVIDLRQTASNLLLFFLYRNALPDPSPVKVLVEITIQDVSEISAVTGTFITDFFVSAIWMDRRFNLI